MSGRALERLVRRDRAIVLAALGAVLVLAWLSLLWIGPRSMMAAPDAMPGMDMPVEVARPGAALLLLFLMWTAMMVGMMTPSVAPTILIYARVARDAGGRGHPFAATGWFAGGYFLAWTGFAAAATGLQWLLQRAAVLTPMATVNDRWISGIVLIAAGLYQWTPVKDACLGRCRSPFQFIQAHGGFQGGRWQSLRLGLKHGAYCIGCCWALMLLLFVGGVMNLLWIAALAVLVLSEKLLPAGRFLGRAAGAAFLLAGAALLAGLA